MSKKPYSAQRFFTNRENHFVSFKNAINNLEKRKYNILSFYGVGGIGKTRLKKELIKTIINDKDIIISSSLDFHQTEFRNTSTALHVLYKDLKSNGISFPTFEIAHAVYWQKLHPEQSLSKSSLPFLEEGSIVFDLISMAKDIPLIGILPKIGSLLYKAKKGYEKWWIKNGERELKKLRELDPHEIEHALPYYFALDLNDYLLDFSDKKVIIFFDTYESLWINQSDRKIEKFFSKDQWVRDLIKYIPGILWVLLGREILRWDEIEHDFVWKNYIDQHLLEELSVKDADKFLVNCNIKEKEIRNRIISTSKGLPFYLDLQVDTYQRILQTKSIPKIENFGKNYNDILTRFCRYLSVSEIETLKLLSCSKFWNYDIFKKLVKEFQTGFPITSFRELLNFSFIDKFVQKENTDFLSIHEIMRFHLKMNIEKNVKIDIHLFFCNYYEELLGLETQESIEINSTNLYLIEETIYHKKKGSSLQVYYKWLLNVSVKLYGENKSTSIQESLIKAYDDLEFNDSYLLLISISSEIARLYNWKNDDFESVNLYIDRGIKILDEVFSSKFDSEEDVIEKKPKLLELKANILIQKAEVLHSLDLNLEAYKIYQEAIGIGKKINFRVHLGSYSRLLIELGKVPEAEGYFYNQLRNSLEESDLDSQALFYNDIGNIFNTQMLYNVSIKYFDKSLNLYHDIKGDEHKYFWILQQKYAKCLINIGKAEQAKKILLNTLKWYQKKYEASYYEIGYIYLAFTKCEMRLGNYQDALDYCINCINLLYPKFGLGNKEVIESQTLFCDIIQNILFERNEAKNTFILDNDLLYKQYLNLIQEFEDSFINNFEIIQKTFGYSGSLLESFFEVINSYYTLNGQIEKQEILAKKRMENERVFVEQFRVRKFENLEKEQIKNKEKESLLQRFEKELGILNSSQIDIYKSKLPYHQNSSVYHLSYSENIIKYILESNSNLDFLDFTNSPIYKANEKGNFILNTKSVLDYIYVFFDTVKGKHGKFYVILNKEDIPFRVDLEIDAKTRNLIKQKLKKAKILESTPDYIIVECYMFFQQNLFKSKIKVDSGGFCSLSDEELILENLPIKFEFEISEIEKTFDKEIIRVIHHLESRFKFLNYDEIDNDVFVSFNENVKIIKSNSERIVEYDNEISQIFDHALFIMNKYIKPTYDNQLVFKKEMGLTLDLISGFLKKSKLMQLRNKIVLEPRYKGKIKKLELSKQENDKLIDLLSEQYEIEDSNYKVTLTTLSFFPNTIFCNIKLNEKITKYALKRGEEVYLLDTTNRPIYSVADKDFVLSEKTVMDYLIFFFDSVIGTHGKFHITKSKNDIPYDKKLEINQQTKSRVSKKITPLEIIEVENDQIILKGSVFFKESLFSCKLKVDHKGGCSMFDEKLILENLPIKVNLEK